MEQEHRRITISPSREMALELAAAKDSGCQQGQRAVFRPVDLHLAPQRDLSGNHQPFH